MHRVQAHKFLDLASSTHSNGSSGSGISRRNLLKTAGAVAATTAMAPHALARNFGDDAEPIRYPEPDVVQLDPRFTAKIGNTPIVRLHTGTLWAEGPAWNGVGRYLVWSDIPGNEQLRWLEEDEHVSRQFRYPSRNSNGNTFDWEGRQITCEHETRRVVRYEHDGSVTQLAGPENGQEFNAPNDVVVHREDGSIWFTDPGYGSLLDYEGTEADTGSPQPYRKEAVYRIDPQTGNVAKVADEPFKPNGLCFSPDFSILYVADTGATHYSEAEKIIWAYDVDGDTLKNPRTFADMTLDDQAGLADGIDCDEDGNVWSSAGWVGDGYDGVHIFAPNGDRIGQIRLPEICSNLCFGGSKRNRLFMTGSQSLYAVYVLTHGAHAMGA
ncbi:SMP-30/gluconolactonase/LRE family protein [Fodinicurvata fenggangensis]|uniref:SMP-30/gluconolactonase/LRE family protein n=1 Tax=Fodinicurvata fenggangensis TaxID=1121830 RepID=UPI00068C7CD5|nr:SMP-30/gluconolactonase/LRE family protein [Fodinicurvata fenggangensis]